MNDERNHLEEKLNMLEFYIDNIPDAVYWIMMDGRFRNVNAAACGMLGYSRDELLSLSVHDIDPDYSHESMPSDLELLKRAGTLSLRRSHTARDGRIIPVEITSNYFFFSDVEYICCIVRDITERVKAEEALRMSQFIIDKASFGILRGQADAKILFANEHGARMLGYTRDELCSMSFFDIDPALTQASWLEHRKKLTANGSNTFESEHRRKDGTIFPVEVTVNYQKFQDQVFSCSFFRDITERKRAEEALLFSRFCIDKAAIGIFETDENGTIFNVNDYACTSLGYSKEELCALTVFDIDPAIAPERMIEIKRLLDASGSATIETIHRRKDGTTFPVEITTNVLEFHGRIFGIAFVKDITDRKHAEEALQKSRDELEVRVRERTEQLTSLTAELSLAEERERRCIATELHDQVGQTLILSKIKLESLSHALLSESFSQLTGEIREYLEQSIEEIRSLTFQLSQPLLYEVGLDAAVEWLGEEFEGKYGLQVEFQDDGRNMPLDVESSVALYQMVRELLINAAKHAKAKKVRISVEKLSSKIKISVSDDGSGFDTLNGMRHKNKRSGFGLFNIRQRIEYMGGGFKIKSKINQGTSVTLILPVKEDENSTNGKSP